MRRTLRAVGVLLLVFAIVGPSSAGTVVGVVNGLTDAPSSHDLDITILSTVRRFGAAKFDPVRRGMRLQVEQTFATPKAGASEGLRLLVIVPAICNNPTVELALGDEKLRPTACTPSQVAALVDWLLEQKALPSITREQVRLLSAPLNTDLVEGGTLNLKMSCRVKGEVEGDTLLLTVPQSLHALEDGPIGELEYQIDVGPAASVSVPGYETKIEENTPTDDWRRVHYSARGVVTKGIEDFILHIVR